MTPTTDSCIFGMMLQIGRLEPAIVKQSKRTQGCQDGSRSPGWAKAKSRERTKGCQDGGRGDWGLAPKSRERTHQRPIGPSNISKRTHSPKVARGQPVWRREKRKNELNHTQFTQSLSNNWILVNHTGGARAIHSGLGGIWTTDVRNPETIIAPSSEPQRVVTSRHIGPTMAGLTATGVHRMVCTDSEPGGPPRSMAGRSLAGLATDAGWLEQLDPIARDGTLDDRSHPHPRPQLQRPRLARRVPAVHPGGGRPVAGPLPRHGRRQRLDRRLAASSSPGDGPTSGSSARRTSGWPRSTACWRGWTSRSSCC